MPGRECHEFPDYTSGSSTFSRNFRTEAFGPPAVGTIGAVGPYATRGPGINNWDIAVL
ncbi:MAG: hypothetical protein HY820_38590 [Acidobacteria bacterium]|nr:hypothetical protein [Acidobacteriota bacterium]